MKKLISLGFQSCLLAAILIPSGVGAVELEEVIVTAQKRAQDAQDVALSITAVGPRNLELLNISDPSRLELLVPGFTWGDGGVGGATWPSIRGINTPSQEINLDPSIAFFVNGVYKSRTRQAALGFVDVERVEVLRGPQGTLFGRNSTGGGISLHTVSPSDELGGSVSVDIGNYANRKITAAVNVPFSDTFQGRFVVMSHDRDGYVENVGPGPDSQATDSTYGRASFRYTPTDDVEILARVGKYDLDVKGGGTFGYKRLGIMVADYGDGTAGRSIGGSPVYVNVRTGTDGVPDVTFPSGASVDLGRTVVQSDPYKIDTDFPETTKSDATEFSLEVNVDFDSVMFKSITSYDGYYSEPIDDLDKTSTLTTGVTTDQSVNITQDVETITQEFQLASNDDGDVSWVTGVYFLEDEMYELFDVNLVNANNLHVVTRNAWVDVNSKAVFGQVSWALSDTFTLTTGGRYTEDEKDFLQGDRCTAGPCDGPNGLKLTADIDGEKFDRFTWRVAGEWRLDENTLAYGSVATGFRSGGFTRKADDPATTKNEAIVSEEENISYEIGLKKELLDNRVRLNFSAYHTTIENQQVSTVNVIPGTVTGQASLDNAGETSSYGLELELQAMLTEQWFLMGAFAYNNAEYDEYFTTGMSDIDGHASFDDALDGVIDGRVDLKGNKPPRAPELTASLSAGYEVHVGSAVLTPLLTVQYSDEYYNSFYNGSLDYQESYLKVDFSLNYKSDDGKWNVGAYAQNITDEAVQTRGTYGSRNDYFVAYGMPRNYGVKVGYNF